MNAPSSNLRCIQGVLLTDRLAAKEASLNLYVGAILRPVLSQAQFRELTKINKLLQGDLDGLWGI